MLWNRLAYPCVVLFLGFSSLCCGLEGKGNEINFYECNIIFSFKLYFGFLPINCQNAKVYKIIGVVKDGRGYGYLCHDFMGGGLSLFLPVYCCYMIYITYWTRCCWVFFFTLKIHVRKYLMTARDRLEIWSINADSSIKSAINLYG